MRSEQGPPPRLCSGPIFYHGLIQRSEEPMGGPGPNAVHPAPLPLCPLPGGKRAKGQTPITLSLHLMTPA